MNIDRIRWGVLKAQPEFRSRFGSAFKAKRNELGLNQENVGHLAKSSARTVSRVETGDFEWVSLKKVRQLAKEIEETVESLVERADGAPSTAGPVRLDLPSHLQFLEDQRAAILNSSLLPWEVQRPISLRFLWPDLLAPAPLKMVRNPQTTDLISWSSNKSIGHNVAVVGQPGIGKSTTLRFLVLKTTERYMKGESGLYPLYLHLADVASPERIAALKTRIEGLRLPEPASILLVLDGIDEVEANARLGGITSVATTPNLGALLIGCRADVFQQLFRHPELSSMIDEIVECLEWNFEAHVLPFAEAYCKRLEREKDFEVLRASCSTFPKLRQFVTNPFHLTLILFIIQDGGVITDELLLSRYNVYKKFYQHWLARERKRGTSKELTDKVFLLHRDVATALLRAKSHRLSTADTAHLLSDYGVALEDTAFTGLLSVRVNLFDDQLQVEGFRHETLQEYFLAESILHALSRPSEDLDLLLPEYNAEVNSFIREAFAQMPLEKRQQIASRLSKAYDKYFSAKTSAPSVGGKPNEPTPATRIREQAIYYLGRLNLPKCPEILVHCYKSDPDPISRRAAALGAILHGHEDIEADFISELQRSKQAATLNRSVQLVYFGDVDDSIYHFRDHGRCSWDKTRNAIMARLNGNGDRDMHLRHWDLETLHSLLKSRPADRLTLEEITIVASTSCSWPDHSKSREAALEVYREAILAIHGDLNVAG